jgi:peptidoglycan/xylan/chitin deacetylase (PgdA/CDA1 family)
VSTLAILGYHKLGPAGPGGWETWYHLPEAVFAAHLETLRSGGWEVIDAATLVAGLADPASLPERAALITFDDGHRSVREVGLPWLERHGFPAVLFMPTAYVGRTNEFDEGSEPEEPLCDWDDLAALTAGGVSIQSHGVSHRAFSELSPAERLEELSGSRTVLEARLGRAVDLLAYPYGDDAGVPTALRSALADAGYRAACGYGGGPFTPPGPDPYRLARVAIGPDTDLPAILAAAR